MWQGEAAGTMPAATNKRFVTGENVGARSRYAAESIQSHKCKKLQRQLKAWNAIQAGEVAYELTQYLNIEIPASCAVTLCLKCPELAKKIFDQVCEEIPF